MRAEPPSNDRRTTVGRSSNLRRTLAAITLCAVAGRTGALARQAELIDRTLALVAGQVITLSDTRAAVDLALIDAPAPGANPVADVTNRLVDRELVLREVQRYAPPAPTEAAIDARVTPVRERFADAAAFTRALATYGFTESRLRAWVRDDLRIQAYFGQRFAAAGGATDAEVAAEYARLRATFDANGVSAEEAEGALRERIATSRRRTLIADWTADLRRRGDVVLLLDR